MSAVRVLVRSLFRQIHNIGQVAARSGYNSAGEFAAVSSVANGQSALILRAPKKNVGVFARGLWSGFTSRVGSVSQAASLRRMAIARMLRGCGPKSPMFAFLGFAVAISSEDGQRKEPYKKLHQTAQRALLTKNMFAELQKDFEEPSLAQLKLKDFKVGERLGQSSSNSAVYSAEYMGHEYAIKMLFNYGTSSQSSSLKREFSKEYQVLSAKNECNASQAGLSYTRLSAHPNISPILHHFTDDIPVLPDASTSYPAALPCSSGGLARNRTMFLVMPRYDRTVREYLASNSKPDLQVSSLLLLQLLEGIRHLTRHGVAHRDLKTDNLLLGEDTNSSFPQLVIADFGCCLADRSRELVLPFQTAEIDRGGNFTLMAPEIALAVPGKDSVLDFTKSDAWAAGAIAYEFFGNVNPFGWDGLDSRNYKDDDLPVLVQVQPGVRKVVSLLLKRDPAERITAETAITMLILVLRAPAEWHQGEDVQVENINWWLFCISLEMLGSEFQRAWTLEDKIMYRFLCRVTSNQIKDALELLTNDV